MSEAEYVAVTALTTVRHAKRLLHELLLPKDLGDEPRLRCLAELQKLERSLSPRVKIGPGEPNSPRKNPAGRAVTPAGREARP